MGENGQQKWRLEGKAYESFRKLMASADETRTLFEEADLELPEPLARFLGVVPHEEAQGLRISVSPPPHPPCPPEADPDWIWVPIHDLLLQTMMLAIMRGHGGPISAKAIQEKASVYDPDVNLTSLYNAGARLEKDEILSKLEHGWSLNNPSDAPVLHGEYAWGPPRVFSRQEIAAHRRLIIHHLLSVAPDGMQVMQIVRHFRQDPALYPPALGAVTKDLVKIDLEKMSSYRRVRRVGQSRKWVAINAK